MERLLKMLRATKARVVTGGTSAASDRYLAPTVLADLNWGRWMGSNGRAAVDAAFSWDNIAAQTEEVYASVA